MTKTKTTLETNPELQHIISQLRPLAVEVEPLKEDPENARFHTEYNIESIKSSVKQFKQRKPIIVNTRTGLVEAGNGMLRAFRELGWKYIAAVFVDDDPTAASGYAIADNRTAELSDWDYKQLAASLKTLQLADFDLTTIGWQKHDLDILLAADWKPPALDPLAAFPPSLKQDAVQVAVTQDQYKIIVQATDKVRQSEEDANMTVGRCLELICGDYLAGA